MWNFISFTLINKEHLLLHSDLACTYAIVCWPEFKGITQYFVFELDVGEPSLKA